MKIKNIDLSEYEEVEINAIETKKHDDLMYDITVEDNHTFFIKKNKDLILSKNCDGNAICGLLLNFFHKYWPELIEEGKVIRVLSPLFIATRAKERKIFYTFGEYNSWEENDSSWKIKYNKGLGSLNTREYADMISDMKYLKFQLDKKSKDTLKLVYCSDSAPRKTWLSEAKG